MTIFGGSHDAVGEAPQRSFLFAGYAARISRQVTGGDYAAGVQQDVTLVIPTASNLAIDFSQATAAPTISSLSPETSVVVGDGVADVNMPTLKGSAAANSTVAVDDGSTELGVTTASATGGDSSGHVSAAETAVDVVVNTQVLTASVEASVAPALAVMATGAAATASVALAAVAIGDGSSNAPAGAPQVPNVLNSYGANVPTWQVAGVDYHVGVPDGLTLKDPSTISMAGVSVDAVHHIVKVTGSNVTLNGYDFSGGGGWQVNVQAANTTIENCNFVVGSNNQTPIYGTSGASNLSVIACTINGAGHDCNPTGGLITYSGDSFTVDHCWLHDSGSGMIQQQGGGSGSTITIEHNLIQNAGLLSGHGAYTQLFTSGPATVEINYNTTTQSGSLSQGLMTDAYQHGEITHNVMIGSCTFFTSMDIKTLSGTMAVQDNYYDASKAYGFIYPNAGPDDSSSLSIFTHNVNMTNGAVLQDSTAAPTISSWSPDTGVVGDGITDVNTPKLSGSAAANSTVTVYDGSTKLGVATADSTGAWSFTTAKLSDGIHSVTVTNTNSSGLVSAASKAVTITVDTHAPAAPVESGYSIVNGNHALVSGTAEANSAIAVYDGTTVVGAATTTASGTWSLTTTALASGAHALTATATDAAGNKSAVSTALGLAIVSPPAAPTISSWSPDTGVVGDGITDVNTPKLTGSAVANSTVTVYDGSTKLGVATADSTGAWSFTTAKLSDGTHVLTATDTNSSGLVSAASTAATITVDTHAPAAPVESGYSIVNGNHALVSGTAEANSAIAVYDGTTVVGTAATTASGAWSLTTTALASGAHALTATSTDAAGNKSAASTALGLAIVSPPAAPTISSWSPDTGVVGDGITDVNTPKLTGSAAANSTVTVYDGSTKLGVATADSTGAWSFTTAKLGDGTHVLTATDTNTAGVSAASTAATITVDTHAPAAPVETSDSVVNGNHVLISGTAEANSAIAVYDGTTVVGTAATTASGAWSLTTAALSSGAHALTAIATDAAGNASAASAAVDPVIGSTAGGQFPNLLQAYNLYHPTWQVAGVDYHVGVPNGLTLKDASTISMAGVSVDAVHHVVTVTGNNVTLDGYDFSGGGGWQVSVQAAHTTIKDCNFVVGSNNMVPISGTSRASDLSVAYCTINGAGHDPSPSGGLITYSGTNLSVEYSWLHDSGGDMIQQVGGSNCTITVEHNLIQNAGMAVGAHGDYTQILTSGSATVEINYNTTTQAPQANGTMSQGLMTDAYQHGDITHNVMIGSCTYFTSMDLAHLTGTMTAQDNYFDISKAYGFVYPNSGPNDSSSQSVFIHNVNMSTGAVLQDSNWAAELAAQTTSTAAATLTSGASALTALTATATDTTGTTNSVSATADSAIGSTGAVNFTGLDQTTITGAADANALIKLSSNGTAFGTATSDASGHWSINVGSLSNTVHTFTAQEVDSSGHVIGKGSGDAIIGTHGSDALTSTGGSDVFFGNGSIDTFDFRPGFTHSIVTDGGLNEQFVFSATEFTDFAHLLAHAAQVGVDAVFSHGSDTLTLKNTKITDLHSADFHFA